MIKINLFLIEGMFILAHVFVEVWRVILVCTGKAGGWVYVNEWCDEVAQDDRGRVKLKLVKTS